MSLRVASKPFNRHHALPHIYDDSVHLSIVKCLIIYLMSIYFAQEIKGCTF